MAITVNHLTDGGVDASQQVYQTAEISPGSNTLISLHVFARGGQISQVTGCNLTWTLVDSVAEASNGYSIWHYQGTGTPSTDKLTIEFSTAPSRCAWSVDEFAGAIDIVQSNRETTAGAGEITVTLNAFGSNDNAVIGAVVDKHDISIESGYTNLAELTIGTSWDRIWVCFVFKNVPDTTVWFGFDYSAAAALAAELAAGGGGPSSYSFSGSGGGIGGGAAQWSGTLTLTGSGGGVAGGAAQWSSSTGGTSLTFVGSGGGVAGGACSVTRWFYYIGSGGGVVGGGIPLELPYLPYLGAPSLIASYESYSFKIGAQRRVGSIAITTSASIRLVKILYLDPDEGWLPLDGTGLPRSLVPGTSVLTFPYPVEVLEFELLGFDLHNIVGCMVNDFQETRLRTVEEILDSITNAFQIDDTQVFLPDRPLVARKTVKAQEGHGQFIDFPSMEAGYPNLRNGVLRFYCIDTVNYIEIESPDGITTSFKVYIPDFSGNARLVLADTNDRAVVDKVDASTAYLVGGRQVIADRVTGWQQASGSADRTSFDTETAATKEVARRLKALIDDLFSHGLIGS
jgi:hypothetical protein